VLRNTSCFFSAGEAIYGTFLEFDIRCLERLGYSGNGGSNVPELLRRELEKLGPVLRRYMPWQEILVVVAKAPRLLPLVKPPTELPQTVVSSARGIETHSIESRAVEPTVLITLVVLLGTVALVYTVRRWI